MGMGLGVWLMSACTWITRPDAPHEAEDQPKDEPENEAEPPDLVALVPGSAGRINVLIVEWALSGAELRLSSGDAAQEPVEGCPYLTQDVGSPVAVAAADGTASMEVLVDEALLGQSVSYQIVQVQDCTVSDTIRVDFPLRVDFDLSDADAELVGEYGTGESVAGAGDVNGDGFDDLLINTSYGYSEELACLFLGPVTGSLGLDSADAIFTREQAGDEGGPVASAGDVDGDGLDDLLVGSYAYGGGVDRVHLFSGPVTGERGLGSADAIFDGGLDLSGAGDVNGDGLDDILVASPERTYLFFGPVAGELGPANADAAFEGSSGSETGALRVAGGGDVNGDGFGDLLLGAPFDDAGGDFAGRVYLFLGPVEGSLDLADADAIFTGEEPAGRAGSSLALAGDVDGDGFDDILIGAPSDSDEGTSGGRTYLFSGPVTGELGPSDADATFEGELGAGESVAGAGDVNGDGFDDLVVGAPDSPGRAYLFLGPVKGQLDLADADVTFLGEGGFAGKSVAGAGDVDGDGLGDLIIGAPGDSARRAYLILGESL